VSSAGATVAADAILVRAPVGLVYRLLTDVAAWAAWWPDARSTVHPVVGGPGASGDPSVAGASEDTTATSYRLELPTGRRRPRRRLRLLVEPHGWRHDLGMHLRVHGSLVVTCEWWLEECREGVVVHQLVRGDRRAVGRMRRAIGLGLQAFKDHAELAVAVAVGRVP
jgi:hypothetical protein